MRYRHVPLAAASAGALIAAGLAVASGPALAAGAGCSVAYTVQSQWSGGFTANVSVTNLGSPVTDWRLGFDFPAST